MIGQKLGSFRIEAKIGSGAMGTVYRGIQEPSGRTAALKVIVNDQGNKGNATGRFRRESDILQQFRHPNIVRFLAVGRSQGVLYFAMEYVPGGTLEQLLQRREYLPWPEAVDLALQVCEALQYAHEHGVVHRDLKPSNLMTTEDGRVKLTDFGIAKDLDATALTATGRTMGTAAYMAPEQIRGTPEISHKTDLYALGCVLYQMLTGQPPFSGKSAVVLMHSHLTEPPPRPSARNPDMPRALDDLVLALMAKDPTERPWDAAAVGQILADLKEKAARGESVPLVFGKVDAPTRPGALPPADSAIAGATTSGTATAARPRKKKAARKRTPAEWLRANLGTLGLIGAAAAVAGVLLYTQWPPSKEYIFREAERMMASPSTADWRQARREYIDDLASRYPDFHRQEVAAWLDRIALDEARGRADVLERPNLLRTSKPQDGAEEAYVDAFKQTYEATQIGLEQQAVPIWRRTAAALRETIPQADEPRMRDKLRGFALLADARAEELEAAMQKRRKAVLATLDLADAAEKADNLPEAVRLRRQVIANFSRHPELADLIDRAHVGIPPTPEPAAEADGKPEAPEPATQDEAAEESPAPSSPKT